MLTWSVLLLLLVIGLFIGNMSRRNMIYGVKIPIQLIRDERVRKIKTVYIIRYLCVMILLFVAVLFLITSEERQLILFSVLWIVITTILFILSNQDMKKVKEELKNEYKGKSEDTTLKRVTVVWDERKLKKHLALSFVPNWIFLALGFIIYLINYRMIPEEIPLNYDLQGNIINVAEKSIFTVFITHIICIIVTLGVYGLMRLNISAKKEIERLNPEEDGRNLYIARERLNLVLSVVMLCMNIVLLGLPAITFEWIPGGINLIFIISIAMLIVIMLVFVVYMITTGFSGDRLSKVSIEDKGKVVFEKSEEQWKYGMFYYNKDDPALMVEKRMGGGYTFNFGNPKAIIILVGILAVVALIVIGSYIFA